VLDRARLLAARGDAQAALSSLGRIVAPRERSPVALWPDEVRAKTIAAEAKLALGRDDEALALAREALEAIERAQQVRGYHRALEADAALRIGVALLRSGDAMRARPHLERAVQLREVVDDSTSPWLAQARLALAGALERLGDRVRAADLRASAQAAIASHARVGPQFAEPPGATSVARR
jgi:tetratricopeptide (TPR) repeat protein